MKKYIYSGLILAFFFVGNVLAQKKAIIQFDKLDHDFGVIKEENGKVKCRFNFTNVGDDTLKITSVKPGCGCTTASWTKTPVAPKGSGVVDAEFDPAKRPGIFSKNIAVTTNDPTQQFVNLALKGNVMPKEQISSDVFPVVAGNLRLKSSQFNFGNIKNNEVRNDTLRIINNWKKAMTFEVKDLTTPITAKVVPSELKPGKEGLIIVSYDASKRNDYGYVYDRITLKTNDSIQTEKIINLSMNIVEDFSKMTPEQLAAAAKIKFDNVNFKFDKVKQGEKVECSYTFTNQGRSDLYIRKVKASCGCTATNPEKTMLKPGESSKINATFNTQGKDGKQNKTITVISNDPNNTCILLTIEGTVEK